MVLLTSVTSSWLMYFCRIDALLTVPASSLTAAADSADAFDTEAVALPLVDAAVVGEVGC